MKELFIRHKWIGVILGILLVIAGVATIVFAAIDSNTVDEALSIIIAVTLFIVGLFYLIAGTLESLSHFYSSSFVYGGVYIALGVILLVNTAIVPQVMAYTLSIVMIAIGTIYLIRGILCIVNKMDKLIIITSLSIAPIAITLGILSLIFQSVLVVVIYVVCGIIITTAGVVETIIAIKR